MKHSIIIIGALLLVSCASETEKKVLDDIAEIYNGDVSYSKSFVSNESENRRSFNVVIENSIMIDTLPPKVTASSAALLVYNVLTKEEKDTYTDIEVFLVNKQKDTISTYYAIDILAPINEKAKIFREFSQRLIDKKFDQLDELKNNIDITKSMSVNIASGLKATEHKIVGYKFVD